MPLHDLTPQLRTRLNQKERAVGWFVFLATALLLFGFGYYLYHAAQSKGWFLLKAKFYTYVNSAADVSVGDPVFLMGFQVGQITDIAAMPPRTRHNVRIDFYINQVNKSGQPYYGYVWSQGSQVKLNSSGFLGKRGMDITRGTNGFNIYATRQLKTLSLAEAQGVSDPENWRLAQNIFDQNSNLLVRAYTSFTNFSLIAQAKPESVEAFHISVNENHITAVWNEPLQRYVAYDYANQDETNAYELRAEESPAVSDQLQAIIAQVQAAVPNILALTNKLAAVLDNAASATSNLNVTIAAAQPLVNNFTAISGDLRGPGSLAVWALGTNAPSQLATTLTNANLLLVNVNTNLDELTDQIGVTLDNVADITSNLNVQVQASSNLLWGISKTVMDTDDFVQGLKRHWLLRSAFKNKSTNQPAAKTKPPTKTK